jgi:hypothetical protein
MRDFNMVGYVIINNKKEYLYEYSHGRVRWTKHQEIADTYNKKEDAVNVVQKNDA